MPPAVTATSPVSLSMQALVWLIANCPTFQEVVSARTAEEAYERIHWPEARDYDPRQASVPVDERPRAVIAHTGDRSNRRRGPGEWGSRGQGSYDVSFEFVIPELYRERRCDGQAWFDNAFGNVIKEMEDLAGQGDASQRQLFNMSEWELLCAPDPAEGANPHDDGYWYGVIIRVRWPGGA